MKTVKLSQPNDHINLTPMIDMIFLLIIFFILAGKISSDRLSHYITVPPTQTAENMTIPANWGHHVINVFGSSQNEVPSGAPAYNSIQFDDGAIWTTQDTNHFFHYQQLRKALTSIYHASDHYLDPRTHMYILPKVIIEIRADADAEYRMIQEVQQICAHTNDPYQAMKPRLPQNPDHPPEDTYPFINIMFTTRLPLQE